MIVCKIITNLSGDSGNKLLDMITKKGTLLYEFDEENDILFFASLDEKIDIKWVKNIFTRKGFSAYVHEYQIGDDLNYDQYHNQWIANNLDLIQKTIIEKTEQEELQKINRRIDLMDKILDEEIKRQKEEQESLENNNVKNEDIASK